MSNYDPYQKKFPRGRLLQPFATTGRKPIHPVNRVGHESFYKGANAHGYQHDLGAQDVFLDNLGVLFMEQFSDPAHTSGRWRALRHMIDVWDLLQFQAVHKSPWWGGHFNARTRRANSGEPRSLLRFLGEHDLTRLPALLLEVLVLPGRRNRGYDNPSGNLSDPRENDLSDRPRSLIDHWEELWDMNEHSWWRKGRRFGEWLPDPLEPQGWNPNEHQVTEKDRRVYPTGADLPSGISSFVDTVRILHPDQSTPDLPLRVGTRRADQRTFRQCAVDQGDNKTCAASSICTALNVLVRRQYKRVGRSFKFSPAWMHCMSGAASGKSWSQGRLTKESIELVKRSLPCSEKAFPYSHGESDMKKGTWKTSARTKDVMDQTDRFGIPVIRELGGDAVADIKAHLAAGWVVVVSTSMAENFRSPGLNRHGLPLTPFLGEKRLSGHAWCLVGYDHVDGNNQWKHQGRFIALNTWGLGWPHEPILGEGLCHLPFSMFLTECHGAWALRFPFGHSRDSYQSETPIA
jgi:hypothetical protein